MGEIAWDDDDVNAQSKFALQRAAKNTESALWARRMADQNRNRPPLAQVFLNMERDYLQRVEREQACALSMWSF